MGSIIVVIRQLDSSGESILYRWYECRNAGLESRNGHTPEYPRRPRNLTVSILINRNGYIFKLSAPVAAQVDPIHIDVWIASALQRTVAPVLDVGIRLLVQPADGGGRETLLPHSTSVISSICRTDTPDRYISMRASSTLLSRRRYRSMMAVAKKFP